MRNSLSSRHFALELMESRRLLSISASASIALVSTTEQSGHNVYSYDISLKNSGDTTIGTFWFAWTPGADFLPSSPISTDNPAGWSNSLSGENNGTNGTSIEWIANSTDSRLAPGGTLSGFKFVSLDSTADLAGNSPTHTTTKVGSSRVYIGGAFGDAGFSFVASATDTTTAPAAATLAAPKPAKSYVVGKLITLGSTVKSTSKTPFTGTALLTEGDEVLAEASAFTVSTKGAIKLSTTAISPGDHTVQLVYSGDSTHASADSPLFHINVLKAATSVTLKSAPTNVRAGQTLTLTATLASSAAASIARTGSITFKDGTTILGTIDLGSNGAPANSAIFSATSITAGKHSYTAEYSGNTNLLTGKSSARAVTVKVG